MADTAIPNTQLVLNTPLTNPTGTAIVAANNAVAQPTMAIANVMNAHV